MVSQIEIYKLYLETYTNCLSLSLPSGTLGPFMKQMAEAQASAVAVVVERLQQDQYNAQNADKASNKGSILRGPRRR